MWVSCLNKCVYYQYSRSMYYVATAVLLVTRTRVAVPSRICDTSNEDDGHGCYGAMCPMCLETITEATEQEEAHNTIFCEGNGCQACFHQWCAGVTKERYVLLSDSDTSFLCLCCTME